MRIIFLDIDGTMNSKPGQPMLGEEHMRTLNHIVLHSNAKVVITSTYRLWKSLDELSNEFKQAGFIGEIVGKTPLLRYGRPSEIAEFIESFPGIDSYVILDDMASMGELSHKLVCVANTGLGPKHIAASMSHLMI